MAKMLQSIFTDNMNRCIITGIEGRDIEIHHIFSGTDRKKSELYNFTCPLYKTIHPNGAYRTDPNWMELGHWLKRKCQEYFIEVAQIGDRQDWYNLFGRFYDDRNDEKVAIDKTFEWRSV